MQDKKSKGYKYYILIKSAKWFLGGLCILLILLMLWQRGLEKVYARKVLTNAKLIRLVTQNTYYEYYAFDKPFFEVEGTGLSTQHEKTILETAKCKGDIQQIRFNKDSFRVSHLVYVEDGYIVEFNDTGDNPQWTVYKLNKLID